MPSEHDTPSREEITALVKSASEVATHLAIIATSVQAAASAMRDSQSAMLKAVGDMQTSMLATMKESEARLATAIQETKWIWFKLLAAFGGAVGLFLGTLEFFIRWFPHK